MKGSIFYRKDREYWCVQWYTPEKTHIIRKYKGEIMSSKKIAQKLLALMQGDNENGTFRIEKYTNKGWTDTLPYLKQWLETIKGELSPATYKDYSNSIRNHLTPFFKEHQFQLHEIQYDVLRKLLTSINRAGKGKANVMYCLHACLMYAWKSQRIQAMPPFPEKKLYGIVNPTIKWLPEDRQVKVIQAIAIEHQPIFWWLKYHLRRPAEAMVLQRIDYDKEQDIFHIRRGVSNRIEIDRTKTGAEHVIPCHSEFKKVMETMPVSISKYIFTCKTSRSEGKRYTQRIMERLWKNACTEVGEDIGMYAGLKHSSCSQYINEKGLALSDLQTITDHARLESVKRYAKTEVARKRELFETKTTPRLLPVRWEQK